MRKPVFAVRHLERIIEPAGDFLRRLLPRLPLRAFVLCLAGVSVLVNGTAATVALTRARFSAPEPTRLYTDRFGGFMSDLPGKDGTGGYWQPVGDIPRRLTACLVASEDRRFASHPGVDPVSILRAAVSNLEGYPVQGASTLAMQVARLQNPAPRSFANKLVEAYTALFLTLRYGRTGVLRQYYVLAPQGNGIFGFAYAARRYFRKPVQDLSWAECALLTAIVKSPGTLNLFHQEGFRKAERRAGTVLRLVRDQGRMDGETFLIALDQLEDLAAPEKDERPAHSYHFILRLKDEPSLAKTPGAPVADSIRTSLDLGLQNYLQEVADHAMKNYRRSGAWNVSLIVADKKTGEVLGYIGSDDYFDEAHKGSINYANIYRSSGSTLKPFIYALGLMSGRFTPASVLADLPFNIVSPSGEYTAGNFDGDYLGPMLYRYALGNSRNIPVLRILEQVGSDRAFEFLRSLGLVHGDRTMDFYGYNLALGGLYISLEDLVRAYGILANDGQAFELRWTRAEHGETGDGTEKPYLISEAASRQVSMFLSDPLARLPSFHLLSSMDFPFPVAFKTGTSQGMRDAWTVGYSSNYIVGIWLGHPDNELMNHVAGSTVAGLLQAVFAHLEPEQVQGIDEVPFPPPRDTVPVKICRFSGEKASELCAEVSVEYFRKGGEPGTYCSIHRLFAVDKRTGGPLLPGCPPEFVEYATRSVFPTQYALWAAKQGYELPPAPRTEIPETGIRITSPQSGSRIVIDPELPGKFQSLPLRVEVTPSVPDVVWYVDGKEYRETAFPYETRWTLAEGLHTFQAKFPHAQVESDTVSVTVTKY